MTDLKGKTLFITGATRGIGYAIAERAAKDGANIAIIAKTTEPQPTLPGTIFSAAEDLIKAGGNAIGIKTDIRFEDQVLAAVEKTVETFGGIDICINNASAISLTPTVNTEMKRYDLMHNINTRGTFLVSKRKATTGRNPQTGASINIPAANVPKFRPGKSLKETLN